MKNFRKITLGILLSAQILGISYGCSSDSLVSENKLLSNRENQYRSSVIKEGDFKEEEISRLILDFKKNLDYINERGFYEFSESYGINYEIIDLVDKSNGDRSFLMDNIKGLAIDEQVSAIYIFDLTTEIMNKSFVGTKAARAISKKRMTWRCAQAIAMGAAVTVGAIGITAGSGGAGLAMGLFLISKAYSVQDIIENCK